MNKGKISSIHHTPDGRRFPVTGVSQLSVDIASEKVNVSIDTIDHVSGKEREMSLITVSHGDGFQWKGTIMDFKTILAVAKNANVELEHYRCIPECQINKVGINTEATISELESVIKNFGG